MTLAWTSPADFAARAVALDTETAKLQPGLAAPPPVVGSWARWDPARSRVDGGLLRLQGAVGDDALAPLDAAFARLLDDPSIIIVGQNVSFDMGVMAHRSATALGVDLMPRIFAAYAAGRVFDIGIAEQLHAVGRGHLRRDPRTNAGLVDPETREKAGYRLSVLVDLVLGRTNAKVNDFWRKRYWLLHGVPVERWPFEARTYPVDDACNTMEVALAQVGFVPNSGPHRWERDRCKLCGLRLEPGVSAVCTSTWPRMNLHDHATQVAKALALDLGAAWGNRTDPVRAELIYRVQDQAREDGRAQFLEAGLVRPDGTEPDAPAFRAMAEAYGATLPCPACAHATRWFEPGRVPSEKAKLVRCRACKGKPPAVETCECCRGEGKQPDKSVACRKCVGTGLDLSECGVPRTDPSDTWPEGQISTKAEAMTESGSQVLVDFAVWGEGKKITTTYVPDIRNGYAVPLTHRPNPILDTARVSYSGIVQTLPRQMSARMRFLLEEIARRGGPYLMGLRDAFVPRPGRVFYSVDDTGGEMVCHAESCVRLVGYSRLGEALLRGLDIHSVLGATMMGVTYDHFVECLDGKQGPALKKKAKLFRQAAKPGNFGLPGRMGPQKLVLTQRKDGPDTDWEGGPSDLDGRGKRGFRGLRFCLTIGGADWCGKKMIHEWARRPCEPTCAACIDVAVWIKETWLRQYPENKTYLEEVVPAAADRGWVQQHYSGRIRGVSDGGSIANGWFQALLADINARAAFRVAHEQYVRLPVEDEWSQFRGGTSPLYGSRGEIFAHDELIGEADIPVAHEVAERVTEIMEDEFRKGCPNHAAACHAEPTLMDPWLKAAEQVRHCEPCGRDYAKVADCPRCSRRGRLVPWTPPFVEELAREMGIRS